MLPETARLKQEIERVVNEAERKRIKLPVEAQTVDADRELARFRTEQERKKIRQKIEIDEADFKKRLELMGKEFEGLGGKLGGALKLNLGLVGIGTLPAMATAITNVAGALQQLSGAGLAIPGIFAGIASSVGVAKISTMGMADAFKALDKAADGTQASVDAANKALAGLAPNVAETVKTTYGLKGTFEDLRDIGGQNMFAGVSEGLKGLVGNLLPTATRGIDGISKALNQNLLQGMNSLGSGSSQGFLDRIFGNSADAQGKLTAAIDPVVHAVAVLTAAGSDALPRLATAVGAVADRFNKFITTADAQGNLHKWINDGLTGFTRLGNILLNLGKSFVSITQAGGGGTGFLQNIELMTSKWATFLASTDGQDKMKRFFAEGRDMLGQLKDVAVELGPVLGGVFNAGVSAADGWLPVIREILDIINSIPGGAQAAVRAFVAWKTIQGPVQLLNSLTNIARMLDTTLPGAARTGSGGISAALAAVSVPSWLTALVAAGGLPAVTAGFALTADQILKDAPDSPENARARGVKGLASPNPRPIPGGGGPGAQAARRGSAGYTGLPVVAGPDQYAGPGAQAARRGGVPVGAPQDALNIPGVSSYAPPVVTDPGSGGSAAASAGLAPSSPEEFWDAIAAKESGGNWQNADTGGNGHYGGLQFSPETWKAFGGGEFAQMPQLATRQQQMLVADRVAFSGYNGTAPQGLGAWEVITNGSTASKGITVNSPRPTGTAAPPAAAGYPSSAMDSSAYSAAMPEPYGLPQGTNTGGYGTGTSATFPPWVMALAQQFGVTPSTYAGHQETDRNEPGYAPNPQHLNRGIDWSGSPENMQRFAEALASNPLAEQVIYNGTSPVEAVAGQRRPGYFAGDLAEHGDHVHTRFSQSPLSSAYPGDYAAGDPTTMTASQSKSVREAQERVADRGVDVKNAEAELQAMQYKSGVTPQDIAAQQEKIAKAKREHRDAQEDLNIALTKGNDLTAKQGKGGPGEQLGKDIVSGMLDVFGFGDLFKDPTQFGLFKVFKGFMGLKPAGGDGAAGGGTDAGSLFPGGGGGVLDTLTSLIPQPFGPLKSGSPGNAPGEFIPALNGSGGGGIVPPGGMLANPNSPPGAPGPGNGPVVNFNAPVGYSPTAVKDQVNSAHLQQVRQPLRNLPG